MRLLLDENLDHRVAEQLRERGYDVVAVTDDAALRGSSDAALLDWAMAQERAIATYDIGDFLPLVEERVARNEGFAGLILIPWQSFPPGDLAFGHLLRALVIALDAHPARMALAGRTIWLGSP